MQCFAFLSAGTNLAFWVGLLNCSLLKDFRANLLDCLHVFFFILVYDTMSNKFDFASTWPSMDEYIEYFFQKNAATDHSHAC